MGAHLFVQTQLSDQGCCAYYGMDFQISDLLTWMENAAVNTKSNLKLDLKTVIYHISVR